MKKGVIIVIALLACAGAPLFADGAFSGIGAALTTINQSYSVSASSGTQIQKLSLSSLGVQISYLSHAPFGFFGEFVAGIPIQATYAGNTLVMSNYAMRFAIEATGGVGYRMAFGKRAALTVGGGLHLFEGLMSSADASYYLGIPIVAGPGAIAKASLFFTKSVGLYIDGSASYDPLVLFRPVYADYTSGISYSVGVGLAVAR